MLKGSVPQSIKALKQRGTDSLAPLNGDLNFYYYISFSEQIHSLPQVNDGIGLKILIFSS